MYIQKIFTVFSVLQFKIYMIDDSIILPYTGRNSDAAASQKIETPIFFHVIFHDQLSCHRNGHHFILNYWLGVHQVRVERGVCFDHLTLQIDLFS